MKTVLSRRTALLGSAAATALGAFPQVASSRDSSISSQSVREFKLESAKSYADPFWDLQLDVWVTAPDGQRQRIPAFWSGGSQWRWRYSARQPGTYRYKTVANDAGNADLHGVTGEFQVETYSGDNALYRHGALQVSDNKRYLETADKTPFLWLGDTWWMGLCDRLSWPAEFNQLVSDRREKGFNVVQLVAGLYPDMGSFDPRGRNEAGFPWEADYRRIHPAWWDLADQRIEQLVDSELMPCILGCWGYYLKKMGMKNMRAHWRYVVARWAAFPVVWCLAGEGSMPWYLSDNKPQERSELEQGWTELASEVRRTDPFGRLITIHPSRSSRDVVRDPSVLDFDMLQTGHGDFRSMANTLKVVSEAVSRKPVMPVIESEVCYEGIMESCRQDIQRFMFWSTMLNGCCGFTYGANGIWQVNQPNQPFGPSPHGRTWGNTPWQQAMNYPGGKQVGVGAKLLRSLPWQQMKPHPEWVHPHWNDREPHRPSAAGIAEKLRVIYTPALWNQPRLTQLEPGLTYKARLVNPSTGQATPMGDVEADNKGEHSLQTFPEQRDWVIVLQR